MTSRAYQMPAVTRTAEPPARGYVFDGPEIRRLTAEQFADAIGAVTGEWEIDPVERIERGTPAAGRHGCSHGAAADPGHDGGVLCARLACGLDRPDPRPGAPDPRPGDLDPGDAVDDAAGAGAGEWGDLDAAAVARGAPDARRTAAGAGEPLQPRRWPDARARRARFDIDISRRGTAVAGRAGDRIQRRRRRCSRHGRRRSWCRRTAWCRCRRSTPVDPQACGPAPVRSPCPTAAGRASACGTRRSWSTTSAAAASRGSAA